MKLTNLYRAPYFEIVEIRKLVTPPNFASILPPSVLGTCKTSLSDSNDFFKETLHERLVSIAWRCLIQTRSTEKLFTPFRGLFIHFYKNNKNAQLYSVKFSTLL